MSCDKYALRHACMFLWFERGFATPLIWCGTTEEGLCDLKKICLFGNQLEWTSGFHRGLSVPFVVTYETGMCQIEAVLSLSPEEHSRTWFSAVTALIPVVRTIVNGIDAAFGGCSLGDHSLVNDLQVPIC